MTDEDLRELLEGFRDDIRAHVDAVEARTSAHADATAEGMRRHFDATAERMERRFDFLAEALALLDWKVDTKIAALDERMTRGFADLGATIRFSHANLVHRIERLESRS